MTRSALTALLGLATAAALLGGCSSGDQDNVESSSTPSVLTAPPSPTQGAPAQDTQSPATATASPDGSQTTALITALNAAVPGIADDQEKAVNRARNVCVDIVEGQDETTLASNAGQRFTTATVTMINDAQAAAIVAAVRDTFCHP